MHVHAEKALTLLPTLAVMGGNAIFGFSFMFSRLALDVAAPFVMLMYRFLLAFLQVGAVLSGTGFNILSRKLSGRYSALEHTFVMMLVAYVAFTGLACLTAAPAELLAPLRSPMFLGAMAYLSVLSSIAAFLLLNYASGRLPVGKITAFCNLTTVLSVFAGVVFLGESFTLVTLAAAAVITVGVWGVQKG